MSWWRNWRNHKSDDFLRDTLHELIEEHDSQNLAASHEKMLLGNILNLRDLTAYDVMVPRVDIVAIDVKTELPEVLKLLGKRAHSRLPVYRDHLDEIIGLIHIKDIISNLHRKDQLIIEDLVRDVLIIAPSISVLDLLLKMRATQNHMALIVDEFGGIDGLVTIEDLVEEIVGKIEDEHDTAPAQQIRKMSDYEWVVDSRLSLQEFFEAIIQPHADEVNWNESWQEEVEDIDTLGGLVFMLAGRIPTRGEIIRHENGVEFEIVEADPRRIRRLRVRLTCGKPPHGEDKNTADEDKEGKE